MYNSVFPGNSFKRKQLDLEGRMNRIGSQQTIIMFKKFIVSSLMQRMHIRQIDGGRLFFTSAIVNKIVTSKFPIIII
jgi:hypothetical protein